MSPHPSSQTGADKSPHHAAAESAVTTLREFLAFKLGPEEYGIR